MGTGQQSGSGPTQRPTGGIPESTTKNFYGSTAVPDKLRFTSLVYPMDLGPDNFYPDCICFTIQKRTGVSIADVVTAGSAGVEKAVAAWKGVPKDLQDIIKKEVKNLGDKATAPKIKQAQTAVVDKWNESLPEGTAKITVADSMFELITGAIKSFVVAAKKGQAAALKRGKDGSNILGSIYLNMPNGITFDEKASWSGTELGPVGNIVKGLVGGTGDLGTKIAGAAAGSAGAIVGAAIGGIPSLVAKLGIQGGMFGMAIGAVAAGGTLQRGAEAALGVAQNPYMEMMFTGVGFRSFQFEFIMRPRSADEVDEVSEILKTFRTFTKPTFVEGSLGKSFMDYPMEFQIEFLTWAGGDYSKKQGPSTGEGAVHGGNFISNPFVPKLKNCVCDSVTSNYTPQGVWAAHDQGVPVAVTLGLSFQETELVMAEDVYNKGY